MKMLIKTANDFEEYSQYKFNNLKPVNNLYLSDKMHFMNNLK